MSNLVQIKDNNDRIEVGPGGAIDVLTGGILRLANTAVKAAAADLNLHAGHVALGVYDVVRIYRVALAASDTAGGVFAWQNPEAGSVIVQRVIIDVTTVASGACTLDVGSTAASAATLSDNLIDGLDVHTGTGTFGTGDGADANGKWQQKVAAGKWVTGSKASGATAALVGFAYIWVSSV